MNGRQEHSVSPAELHRLHTVYYDTPDSRLARWGCCLRFQRGEGWTLKIAVPYELNGLVLGEHNFPGEGTEIPAGVLDLGTAYFRGDVPAPVPELRALRTSRQVVADDGRGVANVAEDDVRAVGACSCESEFGVPVVGSQSSVGDVVHAAFAQSVDQIVRLDAQLRVQPDEDVVHHARVAVRRLRSHLRAFLPVLDAHGARALCERLSWLQDGLSEARDADVFLAGMSRLGESLPETDRRALEHVLLPFREAREHAYQRFGAMLREERYVALLRDIVDAAKRPLLATSATGAAWDAAPALVSDAWSTLSKRVRRRTKPPSDRDLHRIRIAAKRVRYLAEAIAPVAGYFVRRLAQSAERLQTVLGEQHDAVVACEWLRTIAADDERAFVAGELAAGANAAGLDARGDWKKAWRAAKRCRRAVEAGPMR